MYKPVSFNVIRSALAWEGIPKPLSLRMLSSFKWPDGSTSAEVIVTWDGHTVMSLEGYASLYDGSAAFTRFKDRVRECFCEDIRPVSAHYEIITDRMAIELYCKVNAHCPEQLPLPIEYLS